jgi:hypothetical protein
LLRGSQKSGLRINWQVAATAAGKNANLIVDLAEWKVAYNGTSTPPPTSIASPAPIVEELGANHREPQDFQKAAEGIRRGHEDVKAGRTKPADQFLDEFALKRGVEH